MRVGRLGWITMLVLTSCGARSNGATATAGTFDSTYPHDHLPPACMGSLDRTAYAQCESGSGDACARAVRGIENDLVVPESMRLVAPGLHDERVECIAAVTARGCWLGSGASCMTLASARIEMGDGARAHGAWLAACDRERADGCWFASGIGVGRGASRGRWPTPTNEQRMLAERACDLQSARACQALADLTLFGETHPSNPIDCAERARVGGGDFTRGYRYWERACLASTMDQGIVCQELREMLLAPSAPRRDQDDLLPMMAVSEPSQAIPSTAPRNEGICDIDPSACPRQRDAPIPPGFVRPAPGDRERLIAAHRAACNGGDLRYCWRGVELEILRFTRSVSAERRNLADGPGWDIGAWARDLCSRGVADACLGFASRYLASYPREWCPTKPTGGVAEITRACALGHPIGCARLGHHLRAIGDPRGAQYLASACQSGVGWACTLR